MMIKVISYKEARLEYFERLKRTNKASLALWEKRLRNKTCCNQTVALDYCNYYGAACGMVLEQMGLDTAELRRALHDVAAESCRHTTDRLEDAK